MDNNDTTATTTTTTMTTAGTAAAAAAGPRQSAENTVDTVRTPGNILSRLDAEMYRILNSTVPGEGEREKWILYREVLQRYLHFFREKEKHRRSGLRPEGGANNADADDDDVDENDRADNHDDRPDDADAGNILTLESELPPLPPPPPPPPEKINDGPASMSHERREHQRRSDEQKSVRGILNKVPKSYRAKARKLLAHLCDVAVPARISWDKDGVTTIDGKFLRGTNIADLVNDAIRERKTARAVGRVQFARLLRDISTPSEFVGNPALHAANLSSTSYMSLAEEPELSTKLREALPRATSTPIAPLALAPSRGFKRSIGETSLVYDSDEDDGDEKRRRRDLFIATAENKNKTRIGTNVSKAASKRRLIDWNLGSSNPSATSAAEEASRRNSRPWFAKSRAPKRAVGDTSLTEKNRKDRHALFIAADKNRYKTRVSGGDTESENKRRLINWNPLE